MSSKHKILVFTDVDGSLLNDKYESTTTEPILKQLNALHVSVVLASSKTRSELAFYRSNWQISDPYIAENGSVIIIPKNYFKKMPHFSKSTQTEGLIELGIPYRTVREKLSQAKKQTGAGIVGFGDMTLEEVAKDACLPLHLAELAKKREYSEPFKILSGNTADILEAIVDSGLCYTKGGRYFAALGCCDKGKAVSILKALYLQQFPNVFTIGVGDSDNDLTMLASVDKPFFIRHQSMIKPVWDEILQYAESLG